MEEIKTRISTSLQVSKDITATARDVNKKSHIRKDTTMQSVDLIGMLIDQNDTMRKNFEQVMNNLLDAQKAIEANNEGVHSNKNVLLAIVDSLNSVGGDLGTMEKEIQKLTELVDVIKGDTNKIFSLALNASIVSSKYSNTSGVFDILANKLNEMSNFINQNLETIVNVVTPITEGVQRLIKSNETVLSDITHGTDSLSELSKILEKQIKSIQELFNRADESGKKIKDQKKMLNDVFVMTQKMDTDAQASIEGSGSVADLAQSLQDEIGSFLEVRNFNFDFISRIQTTREKSDKISKTAQTVNTKSKNQLDFSEESKEFNKTIIQFSNDLKETATLLNRQTAENSKVSNDISQTLSKFNDQLIEVETNMKDSGRIIQKFNDDYKQIDNILEFLKNILKSMHLIGMYSRIESARDTEEFAGFMNISANITSLQKEIQNNIPVIEKNITDTHQLIDSVNSAFKRITDDFEVISKSSDKIITQLKAVVQYNSMTEETSKVMLHNTQEVTSQLDTLDGQLSTLTEVVKFPIEGSELNMKRGAQLVALFDEIAEIIQRNEQSQSA
jgi:methyl-accepting chemotaxis protein